MELYTVLARAVDAHNGGVELKIEIWTVCRPVSYIRIALF
jgi:hypothetical protein